MTKTTNAIWIAIAAAATFLAFGFTNAFAQDVDSSPVLKRIQERGQINMGHRESSVPFSYMNDDGKPQGYSVDICHKIIDEVKNAVGNPNLKINYVPVTSQTRIALMANGTIDLECGSTTNNLTRQKQVDYLPVTFITGTKIASKKGSGITEIEDLQGKTVALSLGTTNEKAIKRVAEEKGIDLKTIMVKDHPQGWLAVESGRADAYASDHVLLYGLISKSKKPEEFQVTGRFLSYDPYGIMVPRNDSTYRRLGTVVIADMMSSGELEALYNKWFNPGPTNIQMPMSDTLKTAFEVQALPH
ncbi:MAG: amino acid ABC transporter substrate-binding protein [Gammaproteobacteria bacterium]|nr:amino acid ABC transporter substrate-binding protein [Gammaproteobacteria bacterium]MDH3412242.1 amino acid ABC transporter substrate-binding protein [Gammaproteobacteria bacterium]